MAGMEALPAARLDEASLITSVTGGTISITIPYHRNVWRRFPMFDVNALGRYRIHLLIAPRNDSGSTWQRGVETILLASRSRIQAKFFELMVPLGVVQHSVPRQVRGTTTEIPCHHADIPAIGYSPCSLRLSRLAPQLSSLRNHTRVFIVPDQGTIWGLP